MSIFLAVGATLCPAACDLVPRSLRVGVPWRLRPLAHHIFNHKLVYWKWLTMSYGSPLAQAAMWHISLSIAVMARFTLVCVIPGVIFPPYHTSCSAIHQPAVWPGAPCHSASLLLDLRALRAM